MSFVDEVCRLCGIGRHDLVEKDVILTRIMAEFAGDEFFRENFAFKGGTCLIKHYLGYYRFSEDLDFTWKNQGLFEKKSRKMIRRQLSGIIDETGLLFENICKKTGLEFKSDKQDRRYIELGGGNKMATFKLWYFSETLKKESFIKVQVSFVELLLFGFHKARLKNLVSGKKTDELGFLFPAETKEYTRKIEFDVYDLREILCEKVRAVLTRKGFKARDWLDIFLIEKEGIAATDIQDAVLKKLRFTLDMYKKYRQNLESKKELIGQDLAWAEEQDLLLKPIQETEFYAFNKRFGKFLEETIGSLERPEGIRKKEK